VGGGFGGYGGTGARFSGFESRVYINPETGRQMLIFFFNGKPMKRIPQGFRPKGATVVEEQQTVAAERQRDDDDRDRREQQDPTYLNTPVDKWTDDMYAAYSKAEPMGLIEKGFVGLVGNLIAGPAGALGLTKLAEHAEKKQAEAVQTSLGTKMKAGNITQDQYDIYSSAVKAASDKMFKFLGDGESGSKTGLGLHFSSQQAMRDYYEGSSAASDAGIITGFDDPSFVGGGAGWVNPDTGQVGIPSSSSDDGPSAAQIATQNAATESTAEPKPSDGGQDNNPNAPDNDPEDDGGYDFGSAYNYNKGGLIKK
jgi:hypothetical protein